MKHPILAIAGVGICALMLGACASNPSDGQTANSSRQNQVCTYQAQIGSHIGSRHCESRAAHDARQEANHKQAQKNADMDAGGGR